MFQIYAIIAAVTLCIGSVSSWYATRVYYTREILEMQQRASEEQLELAVKYAEKINEGATEHDNNQVIINDLRTQLNKRMRVKIPTCKPGVEATANQDGRAGVFSERVDESFGRFEQRVSELAARCDQLNIDAIRSNATQK